ncbi:MAG: phosphoethanolamine transferase [Prosthecobacter sp.]
MLPCVFGVKVRHWMMCLLPVTLLGPPAIAYLLFTENLPNTFCYLALMESDASELSCFSSQGMYAAAAMLPLVLAAWWVMWRKISPSFKLAIPSRLGIAGMALAMIPFSMTQVGFQNAFRYSFSYTQSVFPIGTLFSVWDAFAFRGRIDQRNALVEHIHVTQDSPAIAQPKKPEVNILVIGESAQSASFQINGYERPTTPRLMKMENLLAFKDVSASATITLAAVPQMLTPSKPGAFLETLDLPSIPAAYRRAGYKVYWLSTQRKHGLYDTTTSTFSEDADEHHFIGGTFDAKNQGAYSGVQDWRLLDPLLKIIARNEPKVLIILHTMGSHGPYTARYPKVLSRFPVSKEDFNSAMVKTRPSDLEKQVIRDAYDNSIFSTDWLLGEIVSQLKRHECYSWLYYISDHGENVSGQLPYGHGTMTTDVLQIPLFIWTSDAYLKSRPEKIQAMKSRLEQPISARSTFHTVLDLAGIRCDGMRPEMSLASAGFHPDARTVSSIGGQVWDYDKDIKPREMNRPGGWKPLFLKKNAAIADPAAHIAKD